MRARAPAVIRTFCSRCSVSGFQDFGLESWGLGLRCQCNIVGNSIMRLVVGEGHYGGGGIKVEAHYFGGAKWST